MHSIPELVRHAETKRLVFNTNTHHVPLMQRSLHLRLMTGRVICISISGGTSRKMRRMKVRTVTPVAQVQTFAARALQTQDLPLDHAEEEAVEVYLERLLGSPPRRNCLPRRPGGTQSEDVDFIQAQTAKLLDDLRQPPPAEQRSSPDSGRYVVEARMKNFHCIVCYCFVLNTAVLPCGHRICTDCAARISQCPLDPTAFIAASTAGNGAVQDAVQGFLLSEGACTARKILAAAGAPMIALRSITKLPTNSDAMQQARLPAFMHLLPADPPDEQAEHPPNKPAA